MPPSPSPLCWSASSPSIWCASCPAHAHLPVPCLLQSTFGCRQVCYLVKLAAVQRRAYKLAAWADATDFLTQLARASGKLGRGGEPDLNTAAKMVLYDWQRGKIPFFELPPGYLPDKPAAAAPAEAVSVRRPASRPLLCAPPFACQHG